MILGRLNHTYPLPDPLRLLRYVTKRTEQHLLVLKVAVHGEYKRVCAVFLRTRGKALFQGIGRGVKLS